MNLFTSKTEKEESDPISTGKKYLEVIFKHEAKKYQCVSSDLKLLIAREADGNIQLMTYSDSQNAVLRIIPDKEILQIVMKEIIMKGILMK